MFKHIILFILIFLTNLIAQQRWDKLNGPIGAVITGLRTKGDTLIIGTGYFKASIYYSTNNGEHWIQSQLDLKNRVADFVFTEDNGIIAACLSNGLYKSNDLMNWFKLTLAADEFWSLGNDYLGNIYAGTETGKIYYSSNYGVDWSIQLNNIGGRVEGFTNDTYNKLLYTGSLKSLLLKDGQWQFLPITISNHYYSPLLVNANTLYAFSNSKLIKRLNSSWLDLDTSRFFQGNYIFDIKYNQRLIASCSDHTGLSGNGWGIALSDDNGYTWRWSNNTGLPPKFSGAVKLVTAGNTTYLGTNAAGVFKSTDFGESWMPINNGITSAEVLDICFDNNGNLFAACWSNGVQKSTDNGVTWKVINNGLTNSYLYSIVADDNGNLMAGTDQGIFRSTDSGENWVQTNSAGNNFGYYLFKDNNNRIYVVNYGRGIYRTSNLGNSWVRLDQSVNSSSAIWGFAIDKNNYMYAGTWRGEIFKSSNDGASWLKVYQSSNSNSIINHITISPKGVIFAGNIYEGILRSTDNGINWELIKGDPDFQNLYPIAANSKGEVFASGAGDKLYYSNDNGNSWLDYTSNLQYTSVRNIVMDKDENIYLATNESIWKINPDSIVSVTENTEIPTEYNLSQNFPNPFNPTTTIKYSVKEAGIVILTVYDILGKEISTLVNETKSPGEYTATFDASSLPSGVYIYTIRSGTFNASRKLVLVK